MALSCRWAQVTVASPPALFISEVPQSESTSPWLFLYCPERYSSLYENRNGLFPYHTWRLSVGYSGLE